MIKLAIVGDIHGAFTSHDVEYFNSSEDSLILVTGDLENMWGSITGAVARRISQIQKNVLVIPGNHDGTTLAQLAAEVASPGFLGGIVGLGHRNRVEKVESKLGSVELSGYSRHHFSSDEGESFDVVAGRPFSMGGSRLSFTPLLRDLYDVSSLADSVRKLKELVDACPSRDIFFLSHNGPTGLGSRRSDIWGRDFGLKEGDHGDPDLAEAIDHAKSMGKRVVAVVAGHMHHPIRGDETRLWHVERDGTHYINAARVPRTFNCMDEELSHYIRLEWEGEVVKVEENFITRDL